MAHHKCHGLLSRVQSVFQLFFLHRAQDRSDQSTGRKTQSNQIIAG